MVHFPKTDYFGDDIVMTKASFKTFSKEAVPINGVNMFSTNCISHLVMLGEN